MRKLLFILLNTIIILGCDKYNSENNNSQVNFEVNELTKAASEKLTWSQGDSIAIFTLNSSAEASNPYLYTVTSDNTTLKYDGSANAIYYDGVATNYQAFYPYVEGQAYADYVAVTDEFAVADDCMSSEKIAASENASFSFTHSCAYVCFNIESTNSAFTSLENIGVSLTIGSQTHTLSSFVSLDADNNLKATVAFFTLAQSQITSDFVVRVFNDDYAFEGALKAMDTDISAWNTGSTYSYNMTLGDN